MLDRHVLVDAHVHVPLLDTLAPAWIDWARQFGRPGILEEIWRPDGTPDPAALDRHMAEQGVDVACCSASTAPRPLAVSRPNVWIELSGLPPTRLPEYYSRFDLARLSRKFIYGTDWPGVPGQAGNARAVAALDIPEDVVPLVLGGNALRVYSGLHPAI